MVIFKYIFDKTVPWTPTSLVEMSIGLSQEVLVGVAIIIARENNLKGSNLHVVYTNQPNQTKPNHVLYTNQPNSELLLYDDVDDAEDVNCCNATVI